MKEMLVTILYHRSNMRWARKHKNEAEYDWYHYLYKHELGCFKRYVMYKLTPKFLRKKDNGDLPF